MRTESREGMDPERGQATGFRRNPVVGRVPVEEALRESSTLAFLRAATSSSNPRGTLAPQLTGRQRLYTPSALLESCTP